MAENPNELSQEQLLKDKQIQNHIKQEIALIDKIQELETKNTMLEQKLAGNNLDLEKETLIRQEQNDQ